MFLWPEGFQRAGSAVRPALWGPLSSSKCLKRRWSRPQIQNQWNIFKNIFKTYTFQLSLLLKVVLLSVPAMLSIH